MIEGGDEHIVHQLSQVGAQSGAGDLADPNRLGVFGGSVGFAFDELEREPARMDHFGIRHVRGVAEPANGGIWVRPVVAGIVNGNHVGYRPARVDAIIEVQIIIRLFRTGAITSLGQKFINFGCDFFFHNRVGNVTIRNNRN